ncbi:MAG: hypothetical protein CMF24_04230 [Ilumatobacter sp.]|nr:hypothetical protein [Ilumatobacter sp.]
MSALIACRPAPILAIVMSQPPNQSTLSPQMLRRRVTALFVLSVVGYSGVKAMAEYFAGDDDVVASIGQGIGESLPTTDVPISVTMPSDGAPDVDPVETATPAATTPEDVAENTGPPSSSNKAKVYIVGDSDAGTFGPYLQRLVDGTEVAETALNYKVSSGLARPDFYNWPEELAQAIPEVDPDIVVATFGGNDSQGLSAFQDELQFVVGDPLDNEVEWTEEYSKRAGDVMDLLLEDGRTVIWVGIPNDDNPDVTAKLAIQDQAAKAAAEARPDVIFIDTWARFSGRDGNWAEFVIDPRDGEGKDVRADDGFHLNVNGAEILALDIAQAIRDDLRARGANI